MRKWKPGWHLKNENGFTLVELLASLAILSMIISLIGSVTMFGIKQYDTQTSAASQSNDYSYALSVLSKEVRSADAEKVDISEGSISVDGTVFVQDESRLIKKTNTEQEVLAENVKSGGFQIVRNADKTINITLESAKQKMYETTIYLRGDDNARFKFPRNISK